MRATLCRAMWLAVGVLSVPGASSISSQIRPGEIERDSIKEELRLYSGLILDYRRGDAAVVDRVLLWDGKRMRRVLAAAESVNDETRPWGLGRFRAGAMMHSDAALRLLQRGEPNTALVHLGTASQLLEKAGPEVRGYAARWYQATARLLRDRASLTTAEQFLETARTRLPHEPTVLYESGTLQELLATDNVMPNVIYLPDLKAPPPNADTVSPDAVGRFTREDVDDLKRRRIGHLNKAAAWLRESFDADQSNMLTRLHLGRVQSLRNQYRDALKLLGPASMSDDPTVAYLALIFTGALHERQGLLEASMRDYRAAIGRFPSNPAAHFALSAVLQRSGHGDESRDILRRGLDRTVTGGREPWWFYLSDPSSVNVTRLDLLRQEARQ